ncbi:hypothetical protein jhhlp_000903 [Lomentospora prolificans]|uniref:Protein PBN1 n=1 Tax=Lomentospora prolificans TaxID=41688 RepID=A0A2N3NJR9_9PEZI|nr:hypothetical protein jhhlp_000903 [Lomentospora prolificans]
MRRRITFIHTPDHGVDPNSIKVDHGIISGPNVLAAREERVTLAVDELPSDLAFKLKNHPGDIHVRWASSTAYGTEEPLSSRISPGLHLLYLPLGPAREDSERVCSLLERYFGSLGCEDPDSFVEVPSNNSARSGPLHYYEAYEKLDHFVGKAHAALCRSSTEGDECTTRVRALGSAASLDISWDTASETLRVTALWPSGTQAVSAKSTAEHRAEVGIFSVDPSAGDPHEIGLGGLVATAATDEKQDPSIVAYTIPSRHRQADSSFSAKVLEPQGLHPTLQLSLSSTYPPSAAAANSEGKEQCKLHAYLTLPKTIFADRYQLADDLFMASKNLTKLRYASQPVDLEMPEYKTPQWGSTVLLDLAPPTNDDSPWTAEIPLHLRYMLPASGGLSQIEMPYPVVFWTCTADRDASFTDSPFDRASLGYDRLFGSRTVFWHVEPRPDPASAAGSDRLVTTLRVPVLAVEKSRWVEAGTSLTILIGFAWVLVSLFFAASRSRKEGSEQAATKKKQ